MYTLQTTTNKLILNVLVRRNYLLLIRRLSEGIPLKKIEKSFLNCMKQTELNGFLRADYAGRK